MDKNLEILNAAQEIFGKFGFAKTSMNDIANQLGISKAALYYYYEDKINLYVAVIEKEQNEFISILHNIVISCDNPLEILQQYVSIRIKHFSKMINLIRNSFEDYLGLKKYTQPVNLKFREKQKIEIQTILEKGIEQGLLFVENKNEIIDLFIETINGLLFNCFKNKDLASVNECDYQHLESKLNLFTKIFINGITKN